MDGKNKRGQSNMIGKVVGGIFGIFILFVIIFTIINIDQGFGSAVGAGFNETSDLFINVFGPLFSALLGADGEENAFLMILTFILVAIIVVGTLDSINIFGEDTKQAGLINLVIGIITAIIGVRFMPQDMWGSLTSPASAFVATILVGIPFLAMFFVSMKVKANLARKLIWIFYLIFMSYLIFFPEEGAGLSNEFMWVYIVFLILAGAMMFFDASVRKFIYKEKREAKMESKLANIDVLKRKDIRVKIDQWTAVINDGDASKEDQAVARRELTKLRKKYGEDLSTV